MFSYSPAFLPGKYCAVILPISTSLPVMHLRLITFMNKIITTVKLS